MCVVNASFAHPTRRNEHVAHRHRSSSPNVVVAAVHVWSYDFVADRASDGPAFRMFTLIDEHSRECLVIVVATAYKRGRLGTAQRLVRPPRRARLSAKRQRGGVHGDEDPRVDLARRRDNAVHRTGQPPGERLRGEFNGKLWDELLAREYFDMLLEAKVLLKRWRREYNTHRPRSSLSDLPPAPEAIEPASFAAATPQRSKPIPTIPVDQDWGEGQGREPPANARAGPGEARFVFELRHDAVVFPAGKRAGCRSSSCGASVITR
jgi:transposase InsO family protein